MRQPHFCRLRFFCQICSLVHGHVFVLPGLGLLAVLTIHALADKEIRMFSILRNDRNRPGIGTVGDLQSLTVRSQHHIRCIGHTVKLQRLTLLKTAPCLHRHILSPGTFHIKAAHPRNGDGIAVADHIVVHPVGIDHIRSDMKLMSVFFQFDEF